MSPIGASPQSINEMEEPAIDMATFRAEIAALIEERRIGNKEWEDFKAEKIKELLPNNYADYKYDTKIELEILRQWEAEPRKPGNMLEFIKANPDDTEINLDGLTEKDAEMWRNVHYAIDSITEDDWIKYDKDVKNSKNISRQKFKGVIANKLIPSFTKKQLEKEDERTSFREAA